jgi:glyoxylase-like metal-dependent hydrolase (beta-lactamase superfamily II)
LAVNTHFHEDHVGGNSALMESFGIDIYAHPDSIPHIAERPFLYPYQELVWGYPEPTMVKPVHDVIRTARYEFIVVETPGHSEGHVALMELSRGWCFSGDIFTRERVKFIRPEENVRAQISSMKKILSLAGSDLTLFTALGRVVDDGRRALGECIENLESLGRRVKALSGEGRSTGEIVEIVFGGESAFSDLTNGQFSSKNLVISLLAEE